MKPYKVYLINTLITVLICTLFLVGTAYASTGCFPDTNGHWAETFICWLKDNGITTGYPDGTYGPGNNVTRAEMSVFLQRTYDLAVNVPPSAGEIRINSGPNSWDWMGTQPGPLSIFRYDLYIGFTSPTNNSSATFIMTPSFPSAIYGRVLNVTGMEYCYTANANAFIISVQVTKNDQTSGATGSYTLLLNDGTARTDAACRYYSITPTAVNDNTALAMYLNANWGPSGGGTQLRLGRVTFFFQPTSTLVSAPMGLETISDDTLDTLDITRPTP